jgi:hypothetical protein
MNNLAERIPVVGKLIKGSERAYVGFLNRMRVDIFKGFMDTAMSEGKTVENSPELYKAMAEYINSTTGRGSVGKLEAAAPILNSLFFSPRLIASRLNLLTTPFNPKKYTSLPKEVRVEYFKGLAKFVGVGLSVLALAQLGGAEVEDDPRSSDFGKIKSGNTRWDIWGGFQQYIRVFAQLLSGQRKSSNSGNIQELDGSGAFGTNRGDVATSFARGKLAPVPSMAWNFISGTTPTGDDVTVLGEAKSHLMPLMVGDMKEAIKDRGVSALFTVGMPTIFGVGTSTYKPNQTSPIFSKDEVVNNPTLKTYYSKGIEFNPPKKGQHKVDINKEHPEGLMTDDEWTKWKEHYKKVLTEGLPMNVLGEKAVDGLDKILSKKYTVEDKDEYDNSVSTKYQVGNNLSKEELERVVTDLKGKASKYANIMMKLKSDAKITKEVKESE